MSARRALQLRRASRRHYCRIAAARRRAGLTTRGGPRTRQVYPQLNARGLHGKARKAALQRIRRRQLVSEGLTIRGTERIRRMPLPKPQQAAARLRHAAAYYQKRRQSFLDLGLTAQGKTRRRKISSIPTDRERAWRQFRATLDIPASDFLTLAERSELL